MTISEIEVSIATKNPTNTREHWSARAKRNKAHRGAVTLVLRQCALGEVFTALNVGDTVRVTMTRVSPRRMDDDGAVAALKSVRDSVAAFFGVDDGDARWDWRVVQARGEACVRISFSTRDVQMEAGHA